MIKELTVGSLEENCYILYNDKSNECIVIDPGDEYERIVAECKKVNKRPSYVLLTHGHFDHIGACKKLRDNGAKIYIHKADANKLHGDRVAELFGFKYDYCDADALLDGGETLTLAGFNIDVIHTPGHSGGSVCYKVESEGIIFVGDTVFFRSYGRFDFPDGSYTELYDSIVNKLFKIGERDYILYCGHGISTMMNDEKKYNPILRN